MPEPASTDGRRRERQQTGAPARRSAEGGPAARRGATTRPTCPDGDAQQAKYRWIQAQHSPRHLILTLFGLYARAEGNRLSVRSLIALMAELDVDAAATRSSVSRLKKRGILDPIRVDGQAGYALSDGALALLREGDARIWSRPRASVEDGWLVVVFSVPESERGKRHELRSLLTRLGFGSAAPGVWVAPGTAYDETLAAVDRRGLASYTELFRGDYLGVGPASGRVGEWWDLPAIAELYDEFLTDHRALLRLRDPEPARAFAAYVPMLTAWRRLPYLDPGIPLELLPDGWPGMSAAELFSTLDERLREPATKHAIGLIEESS